jgi:hypothetical protein
MTEKHIIMSAPSVRAILDGKKTQTRRVIKPSWSRCLDLDDEEDRAKALERSPYQAGGVLWVRETWAIDFLELRKWSTVGSVLDAVTTERSVTVSYRADDGLREVKTSKEAYAQARRVTDRHGLATWRPSIYMPRWASRISLEITNVCVERLQAISHNDAIHEGMVPMFTEAAQRRCFQIEWDKLNAKRGYPWSSDPFVWVVAFKRRT